MEKNKSKESDNVRVIVRCRPMNQTETESNCTQVVMVSNEQTAKNSLPNWVVSAYATDTFKARLDTFWHSQDIIYDFRAQLQGTGSRSEVLCEKF